MEGFLAIISSFPTVPLTVALGIVVSYWVFALVTGGLHGDGGADGGDGLGVGDSLSGGVKGAGDAVLGGVKGAGDAVLGGVKGVADAASGGVTGDAVLGGVKGAGDAVLGGVKGVADAALGGVKGAHEALGPHGDADGELSEGGVLALLGLGRVPVTIVLSASALLAWTLSALACVAVEPQALLLQLAIFFGASVGGLLGAALALRPLGRALAASRPTRRRDALGQLCVITSGRVDASFGTAIVSDGAAGLNVDVRCSRPNQLKKGDRGLVVDFEPRDNVYEIEPVDWLDPEELDALADPTRARQVLSAHVRHRR